MDTDKLNRELQIFRNNVKIARQNIIHKLVRDLKFWKTKQEANPENSRAARKVKSLEPLITHIRSLTAPELAKAVIKFKQKTDVGTKEPSVEERVLLRFHENKKLKPEVNKLIRRFGLNSKMELLDKYLKNPGEGKKSKEKSKKKKTKKTKERKEKQAEQESEDQGFCELETAQEVANDEEIPDDQSIGSISISPSEASDSQSDSEEVGKFVKFTPPKPTKKPKNIVKGQRSKKKITSPEDDEESKCIQIQDSFFVTSAGQSYVATAPVIDRKQQQQEEEEFSWKRSNKRKDLNNKEERPLKRAFRDNDADTKPSWKSKQHQGNTYEFQGPQKRSFEKPSLDRSKRHQEESDLHPSWAAKQKHKGLQPFAGKKIVFDAVGDQKQTTETTSVEDVHPSWAAKQKQRGIKSFAGKKIVFDSCEAAREQTSSNGDVHPSWAAKQKQRGLKAFQGKKTVFDSEVSTKPQTAVPAESDVHPSWAAKQKEKGIKEFQGKKIVFDD